MFVGMHVYVSHHVQVQQLQEVEVELQEQCVRPPARFTYVDLCTYLYYILILNYVDSLLPLRSRVLFKLPYNFDFLLCYFNCL